MGGDGKLRRWGGKVDWSARDASDEEWSSGRGVTRGIIGLVDVPAGDGVELDGVELFVAMGVLAGETAAEVAGDVLVDATGVPAIPEKSSAPQLSYRTKNKSQLT